MLDRVVQWFKGLGRLQKAAVASAAGAVGVLAVALIWGLFALLVALATLLIVGLALWAYNWALERRRRAKSRDYEQAFKARREITDQFKRALDELRRERVDIYKLPWYLFLGEPGGGKSFTIRRSGVDFPLGEAGGLQTLNVDFWFTAEAVIVDTAGRLTIQSHEVVDREQWDEILEQLARYRPNCPIHGAIVGIPCDRLLQDDAATREGKGERIRDRLKELVQVLSVRFPVYVVILKTDLVMGFEPFVKRLPALERKQLFGWANPAPFEQRFDPSSIDAAFDGICGQLERWRLKFLNEELSPEGASELFVFPEEFRALKQPIRDYLAKIFTSGPFPQPGFFRGLFFTSSLQEGRSLPQAIRKLWPDVKEGRVQVTPDQLPSIEARSSPFFVRDLYTRRVFAEKGLVVRTDRSRVSNSVARHGARWGGAAVLLLGLLFFYLNFRGVQGQLREPRADVEAFAAAEAREGGAGGLAGDDPARRVASIERLERLGDRIDEWELRRPATLPPPLSVVYPSPARDRGLLSDLKAIYVHHLSESHLRPFLARVQGLIGQAMPGVAEGARADGPAWADFLASKRMLLDLVALTGDAEPSPAPVAKEPAAAEPAAEGAPGPKPGPSPGPKEATGDPAARFDAIVRTYTERRSPGELTGTAEGDLGYLGDLAREYRRFLRFGGTPAMLRGPGASRLSAIEEAGARIERLLAEILNPSRLGAAQPYDPGDPVGWWRGAIHAGRSFETAYARILDAIVPMKDGTPVPPKVARRADFEAGVKAPWRASFPPLKAAWTSLAAHVGGREGQPPQFVFEALDSELREIQGLYDDLRASLGRGGEGRTDRGVAFLDGQRERALKSFRGFGEAVRRHFGELGYIILVDTEKPPADRAPVPWASLTPEARAVAAGLVRIDDRLFAEAGGSRTSELPAESRRTFHELVAKEHVRLTSGIRDLKDPDGKDLAPTQPRWREAQRAALVEAAVTGALTDVFRGLITDHIAAAQVDADGVPAIAAWFRLAPAQAVSVAGTLLEERGGAAWRSYQTPCRAEVAAQVDALVAFLRERAKDRPASLVLGDDPELQGDKSLESQLVRLLEYYEGKYLDSWLDWTKVIEIVPREPAGAASDGRDWTGYRTRVQDVPVEKLGKTIRLVRDQVTVVSENVRKQPGREWALALTAYQGPDDPPEKSPVKSLEKSLGVFVEFVSGLGSEPVEAMATVRGKPEGWLGGLDGWIASFQASNKSSRADQDLFSGMLRDLSRAGKAALWRECERLFREEWGRVKAECAQRVKERFPFTGPRRFKPEDLRRGSTATEAPLCVSQQDFEDLLRKGGSLARFLDRFLPCVVGKETDFGLCLHADLRMFVDRCRGLQDFALDKDREAFGRIAYSFKVPDETEVGGLAELRQREVYRTFPRLRFPFATGPANYSCNVDKKAKSLEWFASAFEEGMSFASIQEDGGVVEGRLDTPEAAPGGPKVPLEFGVQKAWSLPLFLTSYGRPVGADRKRWLVQYQFPSVTVELDAATSSNLERPVAYLLLELDRPLPDLPDWQKVEPVAVPVRQLGV